VCRYKVVPVCAGCAPVEYECDNGKCIGVGLACNGNNDCGDSSDEIYCGEYHNNDVYMSPLRHAIIH